MLGAVKQAVHRGRRAHRDDGEHHAQRPEPGLAILPQKRRQRHRQPRNEGNGQSE